MTERATGCNSSPRWVTQRCTKIVVKNSDTCTSATVITASQSKDIGLDRTKSAETSRLPAPLL